MNSTTYRARWIAPVSGPPIENGCLEVGQGRVVRVQKSGPSAAPPSAIDFGDAVILPGFVNAHTHLELTGHRGRVPYRGSFVNWIRDLVAVSMSAPSEEVHAIRAGLQQSAAAGVTALADIGHGPAACDQWRDAGLHVAGFLEVLGMGPRRRERHERSASAAITLSSTLMPEDLAIVGLSPHAPYSTDAGVYDAAIEFCKHAHRPICTHLAETREEEQFLRDGTGPFRELLESWGLWDGSFTPPGCSPVAYAERIGLLNHRPLLAHVNYPSDADLDLLAASGASVVYCPRTHRFFEHAPHRYRDMLSRNINVCIGTDSLASNDTLSVLDELRFLRRIDAHTPNEQLLSMGTLNGARALAWEGGIGSLLAGRRADFVVVPLDQVNTREPTEDLLLSSNAPSAVFVSGERIRSHEAVNAAKS